MKYQYKYGGNRTAVYTNRARVESNLLIYSTVQQIYGALIQL